MMSWMLAAASLLVAGQTPELSNAIPLHPADGWTIDVGPGVITVNGDEIALADPVRLTVSEPEAVAVTGETCTLPLFNEKAGGWRKGHRLKSLVAQECSATGLLRPESVVVRSTKDGAIYILGTDYAMDGLWATVGRLEGGAIGENEVVSIDYVYGPARLDSVVVNGSGQVRLVPGTPGLGFDAPPEGRDDEQRIASLWNPGNITALTAENCFPIEFPVVEPTPPESYVAEQFLPKTLAKLEAGEPVTIIAWGDSVTNGGGVGGKKEAWYQHVFHEQLQDRYPISKITLITASWPGRGSRNYIESPAGSEHDFERDVLDPKPDLVTCEWVNDAYLKGEALEKHYAMILERIQGVGAEVMLLTPHLVRPDWMGVSTLKFDDDPRPYVQGLRKFAADNNIALADGAQRWCNLWRQGIPYTSLLANAINHPDARGHALLADALMAVFPE